MYGALYHRFVKVVATPLARHLVEVCPRSRKYPLPGPFPTSIGILSLERVRELHPSGTRGEIACVLSPNALQMAQQHGLDRDRKKGHPISVTLPTSHEDLIRREIHVLDA